MNRHTKCREIEELLYLTDEELSSPELSLLAGHLETCNTCKVKRGNFLSVRTKIINAEAISDCPDFTTSTELIITSGSTISSASAPHGRPGWPVIIKIARYATGIAAALLIILFIWEQTVSVAKISRLETRIQSIQIPSAPGIIDRLTIQAAFRDKEWKEFWVAQDINQAISDPRELVKIRSMVEKRIRSGMKFESGPGNPFSNYLIAKKNIITYKNLIK